MRHQVRHLPFHLGPRLVGRVAAAAAAQAQHVQAVAQRGHGVAQLVGQQGEEVGLALVRLAQRLLRLAASRGRRSRCRTSGRPGPARRGSARRG